jgi:hypothetical protein
MSQYNFQNILAFVQTLIIIGGFIVAIIQINLARNQITVMTEQIKSQYLWQKKQVTFDYLSIYISNFKNSNMKLQEKFDLLKQSGPITKDKLSKELLNDDTRAEIFHLVSYFENLAIGISADYFDDSIAYELLNNVVISNYETLRPYLDVRRNETGINVGLNFEILAKKWKNIRH